MLKLTQIILILSILLIIGIVISRIVKEGFQAGMPGIRCGVDLPHCSNPLQCVNGFCDKLQQPRLIPNQVPVFP
jgi:hypothetical protein